MRKRFNTVIVDELRQEARLVWLEDGDVVGLVDWQTPFSIVHEGKLVDVEIVVSDDVREFALRERQN